MNNSKFMILILLQRKFLRLAICHERQSYGLWYTDKLVVLPSLPVLIFGRQKNRGTRRKLSRRRRDQHEMPHTRLAIVLFSGKATPLAHSSHLVRLWLLQTGHFPNRIYHFYNKFSFKLKLKQFLKLKKANIYCTFSLYRFPR